MSIRKVRVIAMAKSRYLVYGFWERFDKACVDAGYTKLRLSREIGCDRKTLYPKSGYMMNPLFIARAALKLGVTTDYLLGIER